MVLEVCKDSLGNHLLGVTKVDLFHSWFRNRALDDLWSLFLALSPVFPWIYKCQFYSCQLKTLQPCKNLYWKPLLYLSFRAWRNRCCKNCCQWAEQQRTRKRWVKISKTPPQLLPHVSWWCAWFSWKFTTAGASKFSSLGDWHKKSLVLHHATSSSIS